MSDKEKIRKSFSHLHASGDTLSEVLDMISNEKKSRKSIIRRFPAAAAACLILLCAVTVYAATHSEFLQNVFGTGVDGQEETTVTLEGGKTEQYPAIERTDVDEEKAEALTGGYITAVNQSVSAGDYTFTVEDILMDENGIGAVTVHVENPNGLGLDEKAAVLETFGFLAETPASGGQFTFLDAENYLIKDSLTETGATYVWYLTPFDEQSVGEDLRISFRIVTADGSAEDRPEGSLTIPAPAGIPARSFSADGLTASVSPMGMKLSYDFDKGIEKPVQELSIRYADGTEYVVKTEDLSNISVASYAGEDYDTEWIAFNRLAEPDQITEIRISGEYSIDGSETVTPYECTLTPSH